MNDTIGYVVLIVLFGVVACLTAFQPAFLSDQNSFLKGLVTHELLGILGFILAITLASAAQLHVTFNQIEEKHAKKIFVNTRRSVCKSSYWLIGLFISAFFLLIIKPIVATEPYSQSVINGLAIIVVVWTAMILIDITRTAFKVETPVSDD